MVLRPTLKLAAKLKLTPLDDLPPPTHLSLFDWCLRSFMAARKSYLIFTHTQSLTSVVVPRRGVTNAKRLRTAFAAAIHQHLELPPDAQHHISAMLVSLTDCQFSRCRDRAVLGSINDLAWGAECLLARGDSIAETNRSINETPLRLLGMDSPKRCLRNLLNGEIGRSQISVRLNPST